MDKKRLFLLVAFVVLTNVLKAQISTVAYYDGYWGKWKSHTKRYGYGYNINEYGIYGSYSGFIIYQKSDHPSKFIFKFDIYGYWEPDKKEKKEHLKNDEWYEYSAFVEYYVTEEYPTIKEVLRRYDFPHFNCDSGSSDNPCAKRMASAEVRIAPYKDHPKCYNIYFDDVAVGIDLEDSYFNNQ